MIIYSVHFSIISVSRCNSLILSIRYNGLPNCLAGRYFSLTFTSNRTNYQRNIIYIYRNISYTTQFNFEGVKVK